MQLLHEESSTMRSHNGNKEDQVARLDVPALHRNPSNIHQTHHRHLSHHWQQLPSLLLLRNPQKLLLEHRKLELAVLPQHPMLAHTVEQGHSQLHASDHYRPTL